jgi:hypothetical protein
LDHEDDWTLSTNDSETDGTRTSEKDFNSSVPWLKFCQN